MSRSSLDFLKHIIEEADYLIEESKGLDYETFIQDRNLTRAFVRSLEIIGEASKNLDPSIKEKYPDVNWRGMAGMRDILIHRYFGVEFEVVWDAIKNKIPRVRLDIIQMLEKEGKEPN